MLASVLGYTPSTATVQDESIGRSPIATTTTVIAVDKDKNSMQALKWAVDHLVVNNPSIVLLHVRTKPCNHNHGDGGNEPREPNDPEMTELFLPFRAACARRSLLVKELVVEDTDITKALIEFIIANQAHNIVVGASNRNVITRKFKNPDVPSGLTKGAPDFCAVYVISKGKPLTVRSAKAPPPAANGLPPRQPSVVGNQHRVLDHEGLHGRGVGGSKGLPPAAPERRSFERIPEYLKTPPRDRPLSGARTAPTSMLLDGLDQFHNHSRRNSSQDSLFLSDVASFGGSSDFGDSLEFSTVSSDSNSPGSNSQREMEAEMRRLKLELKQTIYMYSTACKKAISAKEKARELNQWKMEEARKFEEARQAEEAALAMVETEKAKSRAAMEAAEAARKIAELEAKKRLNAEMKAKREAEEKQRALEALAQTDVRYRKYTIDEIEKATNCFAESLKIGEGGYGPVYRASLDHTPVAIKVLRPDAQQGKKQFHQEVEVLSCIRHPNMVLLLGACPEYGCLVYEYMDNGSLEDRIFRRGGTPPVPWTTRFKIAAEIVTALLFLHQTKPEPLVHRDLKPANILLDRNYMSKISDVGLARLVPPSVANQVTQYRMTSAAGTFCYIDPEYQQTGMLGIKSDIYSLGVMLLQIITARPPMGLTHHVERAIDKGKFAEMLDPAVKDWPVEEALAYAKLALKCSELRKKDRPDLGTVVLPELNRLRNLGMAYEAERNNSGDRGQDRIRSSSAAAEDKAVTDTEIRKPEKTETEEVKSP